MADKLSRHYAEGRLDETEFKARLDTAMSATTRGDLNGLFYDLPRLPSEPPPPPPRHRRILPWVFLVAFLAIVAGATIPFYPLYHVPWLLFAIVASCCGAGRWAATWHHHTITTGSTADGRTRSWTTEPCVPTPPPTPPDPTATTPLAALRTMALFAGLPEAELEEFAAGATSPPPTRARSCRPRTCPSASGTSSAAGHAVVQRDGTPLGLLGRGDSWSEHSLLNRLRSSIAVVALSPLTLLTLSDCASSSRSPNTTPSWPADWWPGQPARPTAWPCPSSMPWSTWAWPAADFEGSLGCQVRLGVPVTPARGGVKRS